MWVHRVGHWRVLLALLCSAGTKSLSLPGRSRLLQFPSPVFLGLILLPSSRGHKRTFLLLDSLIAMGAMLSIAWFLLLGSLAQTPAESVLAKFLGLYYPTTDIALLSCIVFLLLRGPDRISQAPARRVSLLVLGLGLGVYAISDFNFNVLQN